MKTQTVTGLIIMTLLSGCAEKGIKPMEIPYKIESLVEFKNKLDSCKLKRSFTDFQVMEIKAILDKQCYNLLNNKIVVLGSKDKSKEDEVLKLYKNAQFIYTDTIDNTKVSVLNNKSDYKEFVEAMIRGNAISCNGIIIPYDEELYKATIDSLCKEVTVQSLLDCIPKEEG